MMRNGVVRGKGLELILCAFYLLFSNFVYAQGPIMEKKPRPPILQGLDVNPLNGLVTVSWSAAKEDPRVPAPTGYLIYKLVTNAAGEKNYDLIGTVDAGTFTFTDVNGGAHLEPASYKIAARGPDEPSELTEAHTTMFVKLTYSECDDELTLEWSPYVGWGNRIEQYVIYSGASANWEDHTPMKEFSGTQTSYKTKILANKRFFFYVKAQRKQQEGVTEVQWTSSNLVEVRTRPLRKPNRLTLDTIISNPTENRLTFTIVEQSPLKHYRIMRTDNAQYKVNPLQVGRITDPSNREWADTVGGDAIQGSWRFYRIEGIDECDKVVDSSRLANSITVRVAHRDEHVLISWDTLMVRRENTVMYKLYRRVVGHDAQGTELEEVGTFRSWDRIQSYKDDVSQYQGKGKTGQFCYHVKAWELSGNQRVRMSQSSERCTRVRPEVIVPTAIAPLERGQVNAFTQHTRNVFRPMSTYESSFVLTVYNRSGAIVFHGKDKGWDGVMPDGSTYAPEGAYIYRIEVLSESHSPQVLSGSFMVVYPETKK